MNKRMLKTRNGSLAILATVIWGVGGVYGANITWNGTVSGTQAWSNTVNWTGGVVPGIVSANADQVTIGGTSRFNSPTIEMRDTSGAAFSPDLNKMTIIPRTSGFSNRAVTINQGTGGGQLRLGSGGLQVTDGDSFNYVNINAPIILTANQNWNDNNNTETRVGSMISGDFILTHASGAIRFASTASTFAAFKLSGGTTRLANNSVAGVGAVTGGPLGTGTVTLVSGTLSSNDGTGRTLHNAVLLQGNVTLGATATQTGSLTFTPSTAGTSLNISSATDDVKRTLTCNVPVTIGHAIGETGGGTRLGLTKAGAATLYLNGINTYTGANQINAGALHAIEGVGLSLTNLIFNGGVLESTGTFARVLGSGESSVQWLTGRNGGFAAGGGPLIVQLNGDANAQMVWGSTPSLMDTGTLLFGAITADNVTDFQNPINFNEAARAVDVTDNTGTTADYGILSGVLSGTGASGLIKGGNGRLQLAGAAANTYTGLTSVINGVLELAKPDGVNAVAGDLMIGDTVNIVTARLFSGTSNQIADTATVTVTTNGTFSLAGSVETIATLNVNASGLASLTTGRLSVGTPEAFGTGVYVNVSGVLAGDGAISGSVTVNGGTISPGAPLGSLQCSSTLTLTAGSTLLIELGGTNFTFNGVEKYDRVKTLTNPTTLDGTLIVSLADGFTPSESDLFGIVDIRGTRTGEFLQVPEGAVVLNLQGKKLYITYAGNITDTTVLQTGGNDVVLFVKEFRGTMIQFL